MDNYLYELSQYTTPFLVWYTERAVRILYVVFMVIFIGMFIKIPKASFGTEFFSIDLPILLALTFDWWNGRIYNLLNAIAPYGQWRELKAIFLDPYIVEALFLWSGLMIGMEILRFIPVIAGDKKGEAATK